MAYTPPKVYYSATLDGTYTEITGVQAVNITRGKQRFQDPIAASICVIELIPANSYAVPFALGQFLDIRDSNSGSSAAYFNGRIINIERRYDIPYNSSTGAAPADRILLTVTGGTGALGASFYSTGGGGPFDCNTYMQNSVASDYVYNAAPSVSTGVLYSLPVSDNEQSGLERLNLILNTCQYSVDDYDIARTVNNTWGYPIYSAIYTRPNADPTKAFTLTDNGTTGTDIYRFSGLEYVSSNESTFTQAIVNSNASGVAQQTATSGTRPYNAIVYGTYDSNTTQALSLANYLLTINSQTLPTPFVVESNTAAASDLAKLGKLSECPLGTSVTITFRGATIYATVIGVNFGFYDDRMTARFFFAPSFGTPFTLDSTAFGVLDTNRLGYP